MQSVIDVFLQIVLAIFGAVFFGSLVVALAAFTVGCAFAGGCWTYFGWRKRREARRRR